MSIRMNPVGRILICLLLISFLLSSFSGVCATGTEGSLYPEMEHAQVDYSQMSLEQPDLTQLHTLLEELTASADANAARAPKEVYLTVLEAYDHIYTQYSLAEILYSQNPNSDSVAQLEEGWYQAYSDATDDISIALRDFLKANGSDALSDVLLEGDEDYFLNYEDITEQEEALFDEEHDLVNEYWEIYAEESYEAEYNGEIWTWEKLGQLPADSDEYQDIYYELYKVENEELGELYLKLVRLRNEIASYYGYSSYLEYANDVIYVRDFSEAEISRFTSGVKELLTDTGSELYWAFSDTGESASSLADANAETILDTVEPYIEDIDPRLSEAWNYMRTYHLYDLEPQDSEAVEGNGYTTMLPEYRAPFIFYARVGSWWDHRTVVHEFGHYNAMYHYDEYSFNYNIPMDVQETFSQGLEALFIPYWSEISGGEDLETEILYNLMEPVIDGCRYYEMEKAAYADPDQTLDELNSKFKEISEEYGYVFELQDYLSWIDITHLFEYPGYYLSYATSGAVALELWAMSREDRSAATEAYMQLTAQPDATFKEMQDAADLPSVFKRSTIREIRDSINDYLYPDDTAASESTHSFRSPFWIFTAAILLAVIAIIALILLYKEQKKEE